MPHSGAVSLCTKVQLQQPLLAIQGRRCCWTTSVHGDPDMVRRGVLITPDEPKNSRSMHNEHTPLHTTLCCACIMHQLHSQTAPRTLWGAYKL